MVFNAEDGCLWIPAGPSVPLKFGVNAKSSRIVIAEDIFGPGHLYEDTMNATVFSADKTVDCCCPVLAKNSR